MGRQHKKLENHGASQTLIIIYNKLRLQGTGLQWTNSLIAIQSTVNLDILVTFFGPDFIELWSFISDFGIYENSDQERYDISEI